MSSDLGKILKISVFGESHGPAIGVVIQGLPPGEAVDPEVLRLFMQRRAPGQNRCTTPRKESDTPEFLSGLLDGVTTGAPLAAMIRNQDTRSADYANLQLLPRPGHADYTATLRYNNFHDGRGSGHFSGRLTAPLCLAGGIARQILERRGVVIGAHIARIGTICDTPFDPVALTPEALTAAARAPFPVCNPQAGAAMQTEILAALEQQDSVGGVVEAAVLGFPAGIGSPMFEGVENRLATALFGIPAVRGVEFGTGFAAAGLRGSVHNDPYVPAADGRLRTASNHHGGILGGITSGMPILFRVAFKPPASIGRPQQSVNLSTGKPEILTVNGRHDPCIAVRAVPVVEAVAALVMLDLHLEYL